MTESAREARRAYKRKWNHEHADKVKQYQENYWNKRAAATPAEKEPAADIGQ